uniref:Adenine nucleotide translocase lysine N-methyltransferase isoform X4 n=1 Tax=Petromyzon marinus TaxID=7757 RepID=A0AAJ7TSS5_PETMA|nr:adenine nucleotide translocase lysine N-methyltransferase isoform X4 [Petromyzon marinus]XP_032822048.1 adenine nucleotide translocase lysine N-methyltransferase isoform X4 [Petromyzon marinus]
MRPRKGWQRERERLRTGMEPVDAHEEVHGVGRRARGGERLGGWGLMQAAGCCALSGYAVWALLLMPGFRRVPLRLQVPYLPASPQQVNNVMRLLGGRSGPLADLGSGDGRIVSAGLTAHKFRLLRCTTDPGAEGIRCWRLAAAVSPRPWATSSTHGSSPFRASEPGEPAYVRGPVSSDATCGRLTSRTTIT